MSADGRLRVLLFGRYADEVPGGMQRHVISLVQALHRDVAYLNLAAARGSAPDEGQWHCPVYRSRALAVVASTPICPGMPFAARRLHRSHQFQIAHLHLPDPMSHLAALALPSGVRTVLTWHSDIFRQKSLLGFYWPVLKKLVAGADAVIAATPAHFDSMPQLAALTRPDQRFIVPFGFDLARYQTAHPRAGELKARFGEKIIFALGRHVYYKGFEYLIRAMAEVKDAHLVLGGTGPLTESLLAVTTQTGLMSRISFVGRISEEDLPAYYQACNIFCLPSVERAEAFGIVQVEAMAAGKPVVCTDLRNGVIWVNQDGRTGLAVPPRDAAALARAINRLLSDPALRERLGKAGAERANSCFSLEALRAGTLAVYRKVLDQSRL